MTDHRPVEAISLMTCSCGFQVEAASEQLAEDLMAEHIGEADDERDDIASGEVWP